MNSGTILSLAKCEKLFHQLHDSLITPTEYAAAVGVSYMTVMRKLKAGELPAFILGRNTYIWAGCLPEDETEEETPAQDVPSKEVAVPQADGSKRGMRLPADWMPTQRTIDTIRGEFPALKASQMEHEHRKFCDYWSAQPGQRGVKLDWEATWRNWMRKAFERMSGVSSFGNGTDRKIDGYQESANRLAAAVGHAE